MELDPSFAHAYLAESTELPGAGGAVFYVPEPKAERTGGLAVSVRPHAGDAWIGVFAPGHDYSDGATGLFSCPNPNSLCVAVGGGAYIVQVDQPGVATEVDVAPVVSVVPAPESGLLLLLSFTDLMAYDAEGFRWRTERLAHDGFELTELTESRISGIAQHPAFGPKAFSIDARTGAHVGGSYPKAANG